VKNALAYYTVKVLMAVKNVKVQVRKMLSKAKKLNDIETRKKEKLVAAARNRSGYFPKK